MGEDWWAGSGVWISSCAQHPAYLIKHKLGLCCYFIIILDSNISLGVQSINYFHIKMCRENNAETMQMKPVQFQHQHKSCPKSFMKEKRLCLVHEVLNVEERLASKLRKCHSVGVINEKTLFPGQAHYTSKAKSPRREPVLYPTHAWRRLESPWNKEIFPLTLGEVPNCPMGLFSPIQPPSLFPHVGQ